MKKISILMAGVMAGAAVFAATPSEKAKADADKKAAAAAAKARNEKFKALTKAGDELIRKDFKGGFANYWHDSIDAARAKYEAALKDPDFTVGQKVDLRCRIAQCRLEATRDVEGAMKDFDAAIALAGSDEQALKQAKEAKAKVQGLVDGSYFRAEEQKRKGSAVEIKIEDLFKEGGLEKVQAELPKYLADEQAKGAADKRSKARPYRDAWGYFTGWVRAREETGLLKRPGAREFAVALMENAPADQQPTPESLFGFAAGVVALAEKRVGYAEALIERAKEPKNRIKPASVDEAKFFLKEYGAKGDPDKLIAAFTSTNRVQMAKDLATIARHLLMKGDDAAARKVWAKRESIVPQLPPAALDTPYWKDAPQDVRGIVESDFYRKAEKGLLNRKYGDNLKFLIETDSAILGREMTTDKGEKFRPTEIFAFWDRFGVKIVLRSHVDNMADVKAGFAGAGGYESYLATGVDDPYHCLMIDSKVGAEVGDGFITQYDNVTGYRQLNVKEGSLRVDNLYLDDGVATLVAVSWSAMYAAAPWKREAWYFEPIHWAHGGLSWGGSKSVHHRSSFGKLRFTGGDEAAYTAVKRTILPVAKAKFNAACSARSAGQVEVWSDPELGDQAFYLAEVKPLVDRIKPMMDLVKKDMSDADAVRAWDAAGEDALNIDYLVSLKRTEWLKEKRIRRLR